MKKQNLKQYLLKKIKSHEISTITLHGSSMLPTFFDGQQLKITSVFSLKVGDVVVADKKDSDVFVVHRIEQIDRSIKKVKLIGDNKILENEEWFDFENIIAKVVGPDASHCKNYFEDEVNFIVDIPFHTPKSFDEKTFQIYQSLSAKNKNSFFCDMNIKFNKAIYGEKVFYTFKHSNWENLEYYNEVISLMKIRRAIIKQKYKLYSFSFTRMSICDNTSPQSIVDTIKKYKSTIFYDFYLEQINKIFDIYKLNTFDKTKINFYLSVDNFDKLISAIIFSKTLFDNFSIKPILVDNSTLFNSKFDTTYYTKFFKQIISFYQFCKDIDNLNTTYDAINFDEYFSKFKISSLNIRNECYYKKCKFCDRHSKENFCFNFKNIVDKIENLNKKGVHNILFRDDCLISSYMYKLLTLLNNKNIKIKWQGIFRFDRQLNDEDKIKFFAENGCVYMFFGLESFSQRLLNKMNKGIKIKDVLKILSFCKKYNIRCGSSLLFNYPDEKISDIKKTFRMVKKNISLFHTFELNFFVPTANCKILQYKPNTLNYFYNPSKISKNKQIIIDKLINFLNKNSKLDSFYLKNYSSWL